MAEILARKNVRTIQEIPMESNKNTFPEPETQPGFKTIINCRWCGGIVAEIYIPQLKDGKNGKPREIIYNYKPCKACRDKWQNMVIVIEVTDKELYKNCLPIYGDPNDPNSEKLYPTGRHVGITEQTAKELINDEAKNGNVYFLNANRFNEAFCDYFQNNNES